MKQWYAIFLYIFLCFPFLTKAQNSLEFIANKGQWDGPFLYKTVTGKADVYLEKNCFTYVIGKPDNQDMMDAYHHGEIKTPPVLKFHAYKMVFENALTPDIVGSKEQSTYYNYFLGNKPDRWKSNIHPYLAIDYKGLYDGVDMHIASERGNLKYDFIIQPQKDASQIKLKLVGADDVKIEEGNLKIETSVGEVTEMKPYAYQYINGEKKEIICKYKLRNGNLSYVFPKGYDANQTLIIDPVIVFCTFTGSTSDNWGFTATYDAQGDFYAGGLVSGTGYPVSTGAFQMTYGGGIQSNLFNDSTHGSDYACDIGIIKFNPTGTNRLFATYIGGTDNEQPQSLIVDGNGDLVIAARTYSSNYPVTSGVFDNSYNGGGDLAISKLNSTGTIMVASTFLGGTKEDGINFNSLEFNFGNLKHNYGDDARSEVLVDNANNIYLTSSTKSSNFPITSNATQSTLHGVQDAFVVKFNSSLTTMLYGTYLGGSNDDAGYVLGLNTSQTSFYVAGGTQSTNFPSTGGTLWPSYQGGVCDGFVAKFQNSGTYTLQKTSFIGQADYDQVYGLQVDAQNDVFLTGQTLGGTFPVSAGVYSNPNSSQFIIELDSNLATNLKSTVFGSGTSTQTNISPVAFLVDTCQNIYISGWGGGLGFSPSTVGNTFNMPLSTAPNTPAQSTTDGNDFYFIVLKQGMQSLLYGSYYGRNSTDPGKGEHVDGGTSRFDKNGIVYQAICGGCAGNPNISTTAFPTTAGSWSPNNGFPTNCNEVALKIVFPYGTPNAIAVAGPDTTGCPPFTVTFTDNSLNAVTYLWDFGDGSAGSTVANPPPHTYTTPGNYTVTLVVTNPDGCYKTVDTTHFTIHVSGNSIAADFNYQIVDSCGPYSASFTNNSTYSTTPGSQNFTQFTWSFGDGTTFNGPNPGLHTFPDTGCYTVRLIMKDTSSCNKIDTVQKIVCIHSFLVKAAFNSPDSICLIEGALFANSSVNAQSILWNFGDGKTSTASSPVHTYDSSGVYTITLVATNPNSCNKIDSAKRSIYVGIMPIADFSFAPIIPVTNMPVQFTNLSQNAVSYLWAFGDGSGSTIVNPSHLYKKTGTYKVCLEAKSKDGCVDTVCKLVDADIHPAVDVPTGFSPNGDGVNDILYVRGAAIDQVDFKVYNRFGELVFETTDINIGWDGKYNGKPQEMEAYAWVLDVTFIDETTYHKTGNVTLIR